MEMHEHIYDRPKTIQCPNCGLKMRLNYFTWNQPKYVCDSYRQESDCQMVLMLRD